MTLERFIGYSGLFLILIHTIPFADGFVMIMSILIGVGMILSATYLRWKNKIAHYIRSEHGTMSIPHLFQRLEAEGRSRRSKNTQHTK